MIWRIKSLGSSSKCIFAANGVHFDDGIKVLGVELVNDSIWVTIQTDAFTVEHKPKYPNIMWVELKKNREINKESNT